MTDRDVDERLLRLNAALDGELDAMGSLEFEREMRDDSALAAEYRRLTMLRDAVRRHAPREAAPQALADRIAALTASAPAAPPSPTPAIPSATVVPFRRRAWLDSRALAMAASLGVLGFAVGAGLTSLRTPAGSPDVAQHLVSDFARAEIAGLPAPFLETLVMRDINGLSYREIAEATEAPVGTVMSRLARARAMLAKTLRSEP